MNKRQAAEDKEWPWSYRLRFEGANFPVLDPDCEWANTRFEELMEHVVATVIAVDDEVEVEVGELKAWVFRDVLFTNLAPEQRERGLWEVFDALHETTANYYEKLYDHETGNLRDELVDEFDAADCGDLLIVDQLVLDPAHRGRRLGLKVMSSLIDYFEGRASFVVIQPFPMQFGGPGTQSEWIEKYVTDRFVSDKKKARAKLARYWERLGFRPLEGTDLWGLVMSERRPSVTQALTNNRRRGRDK